MLNSGLDSEQAILLSYFYSGAFALGEISADEFARLHWMIDSGCTDHLSPYLDDFAHLDDTVRYAVVANGQKVPLYGPGKIIVRQESLPSIVLEGVWYAPKATHRLLSVPTLTAQGYKCQIKGTQTTIWNAKGKLVIQASALSPRNNLHWFQSSTITPVMRVLSSLTSEDNFSLWHQRFGHLSKNALRQAPLHVNGMPTSLSPSSTAPCKGCALGKMHERTYADSSKRATRPLELVHTDLVGPLPTESRSRARFILTFIDDYSGFGLVSFVRQKDAVPQHFSNMATWAETYTGHSLTSVRSDRGGEFIGHSMQRFFTDRGITHQTSVPHTPQQNGRAERFNRTMLEKAEAMRHHACMPPSFWQDAAETAVHVYNRQPVRRHNWRTPVELFHGKKPDVSYFRIFGCLAYVHIPQETRENKLSAKAEEMTFVGYAPNTKGYHFWSGKRHRIFVSTNAIFDETVFPHCSKEQGHRPTSIPVEDEIPTPQDDPPIQERPRQDPDPRRVDIYIPRPLEDQRHQQDPQLDQDFFNEVPEDNEPWRPPATPERQPSPVHPPDLFSPPKPGRKRPKPESEHRYPIEDLHQHKRYMLPPHDEEEEEEPPPPSKLWLAPRQQRHETLPEFRMRPHQHHPTRDDRSATRIPPTPIEVRRSNRVPVSRILPDNTYGNRPPIEIERDLHHRPNTPIQEEYVRPAEPMDVLPTNLEDDPNQMYESYARRINNLLSAAIAPDSVPKQYRDVLKLSQDEQKTWRSAMDEEMQSLHDRNVWELVDLPKGRHPIKGRWVFAMKSDGRKKARFVAKGFTQVFGIDYENTFAPVARFESVRNLAAMAALNGWELHSLDVKTAFLFGELEEEIYLEQPEGFVVKGQETKVCRLRKSIYGLKQAALQWNKQLHKSLLEMGFTRSLSDPGTYVKIIGQDIIILIVYVDDALFTGSKESLVNAHVKTFMKRWESRYLGKAKEYLGIRFTRDLSKGTLILDQTRYAEKVIQRFGQENCKPVSTPLPTGYTPRPNSNQASASLRSSYQSVIGSLLYIMLGTRPDIAYAVIKMSQFAANPSEEHLQRALYIVRYLSTTKDLCILYSRHGPSSGLIAYSDTDWGGDPETSRSTTGYVVYLANGPISWISRRQKRVRLSSTEAEYCGMTDTAKQLQWLRNYFSELNCPLKAIPMCVDNHGAIFLASNPAQEGRIKHVRLHEHFIREAIEFGDVELFYVPTNVQFADIFTKNLSKVPFEAGRKALGLIPFPSSNPST